LAWPCDFATNAKRLGRDQSTKQVTVNQAPRGEEVVVSRLQEMMGSATPEEIKSLYSEVKETKDWRLVYKLDRFPELGVGEADIAGHEYTHYSVLQILRAAEAECASRGIPGPDEQIPTDEELAQEIAKSVQYCGGYLYPGTVWHGGQKDRWDETKKEWCGIVHFVRRFDHSKPEDLMAAAQKFVAAATRLTRDHCMSSDMSDGQTFERTEYGWRCVGGYQNLPSWVGAGDDTPDEETSLPYEDLYAIQDVMTP
jgi:hypothetical protein